jgi:hypothetical protein
VQAIRREQELVARQKLDEQRVDLDPFIDADGARDGVLVCHLLDLVARELAALDELVENGVVLGELLHLSAAHHVDAAVAHVPDEALVADDEQGRERRAHAPLLLVALCLFVDARARALHGELEQVQDVAIGDLGGALCAGLVVVDELLLLLHLFVDRAYGEGARHFTGGVPSHSVGDDEEGELLVDEVIVLVVVAYASHVSGGEKVNVLLQAHAAPKTP